MYDISVIEWIMSCNKYGLTIPYYTLLWKYENITMKKVAVPKAVHFECHNSHHFECNNSHFKGHLINSVRLFHSWSLHLKLVNIVEDLLNKLELKLELSENLTIAQLLYFACS